MLVYIVTLFLGYLFLLISRSKKSEKNKIYRMGFVILSILVLTIVAGIRYGVGTDFMMYNDFFYNAKKLPLISPNLEFFFVLLCKVFNPLFKDSFSLFLFTAFFSYYFVYKNAIISNKYYELSIFLFFAFGFYTNTLNVVRQWMAIPILYLGMNYILNNKKTKGIILVIIGLLCHYTSVIPVAMFLILSKIKDDKIRIAIIVLSIILYANLDAFMDFLYKILLSTGYGAKYYKYFTRESYNNLNASIFSYPMLSLITYLAYLLFVPNDQKKNLTKNENFLVSCIAFGFFTALIGTKNNLFERMQLYFIFPMIYIIPMVLEKTSKTNRKIMYVCCLIFGFLLYIYGISKNGGEIIPYTTIFNR